MTRQLITQISPISGSISTYHRDSLSSQDTDGSIFSTTAQRACCKATSLNLNRYSLSSLVITSSLATIYLTRYALASPGIPIRSQRQNFQTALRSSNNLACKGSGHFPREAQFRILDSTGHPVSRVLPVHVNTTPVTGNIT